MNLATFWRIFMILLKRIYNTKNFYWLNRDLNQNVEIFKFEGESFLLDKH